MNILDIKSFDVTFGESNGTIPTSIALATIDEGVWKNHMSASFNWLNAHKQHSGSGKNLQLELSLYDGVTVQTFNLKNANVPDGSEECISREGISLTRVGSKLYVTGMSSSFDGSTNQMDRNSLELSDPFPTNYYGNTRGIVFENVNFGNPITFDVQCTWETDNADVYYNIISSQFTIVTT